MKKNTIKAFTLVEMLIVIVIIGILIASLMPRMQSAQWRARDVARKNDLAQIQTAIITSQQDKWFWPGLNDGGTTGMSISGIKADLLRAWMSSVPSDPNQSNKNSGVWGSIDDGQYGYRIMKRNWVDNGWFVLIAKTEVEWWSNWVVCQSGSTNANSATWWDLSKYSDLKDVTTCTSFYYDESNTNTCTVASGNEKWKCVYNDTSELRYILLY